MVEHKPVIIHNFVYEDVELGKHVMDGEFMLYVYGDPMGKGIKIPAANRTIHIPKPWFGSDVGFYGARLWGGTDLTTRLTYHLKTKVFRVSSGELHIDKEKIHIVGTAFFPQSAKDLTRSLLSDYLKENESDLELIVE